MVDRRAEKKLAPTLSGEIGPTNIIDSGFISQPNPDELIQTEGTVGSPADFVAAEIFEQTGRVTIPGIEEPKTDIHFLTEIREISGDRTQLPTEATSKTALSTITHLFIDYFGDQKIVIDGHNCDDIFLEMLRDTKIHIHTSLLRRYFAMCLYQIHVYFNERRGFDEESLRYINMINNTLSLVLSFGLELPYELKLSLNNLKENPDEEIAVENDAEKDETEQIGRVRINARKLFAKLGLIKEQPSEQRMKIPEPASKSMINFELLETPTCVRELVGSEETEITKLHNELRSLQKEMLRDLMIAVSEMEMKQGIIRRAGRTASADAKAFIAFCRRVKEELSDKGTNIRERGEAIYGRIRRQIPEDADHAELIEELNTYFAHLLNPWDEIFMPQLVHYAKIAFGEKPKPSKVKPNHLPADFNEGMAHYLQGRYSHLTNGAKSRTISPSE